MLNSGQGHPSSSDRSPLARWIRQTLRQQGMRVRFQLRGNNLHLLFESATACPPKAIALNCLLLALKQTDINHLLPDDHPRLYQILLYGRQAGYSHATWAYRIYLNQIDRHLEQLQQAQASASHRSSYESQQTHGTATLTATLLPPVVESGGALVLSNRSQARRGQPDAIARYLSESISTLGIAVQVSVKTISYTTIPTTPNLLNPATAETGFPRRLWVLCEARYSPDPLLIGEPLAQRLRDLELEDFRDAVILIQVIGEPEPDWTLRVDLTPPTEMLREWARWGDGEAIARLVKHALADREIHLSTSVLKEFTLYLSCSLPPGHAGAPDQRVVLEIVAPLLESLGPQGVHAAAIYGQMADQDTPAWMEWLQLPASAHAALAEPPFLLARRGDWEAIAILLTRLLNPDLDKQLATGGIRIQLLRKQDLLHVMTDAPTCPDQRQVTTTVVKFLKSLRLSGIKGLRIYGRRAGQKRPFWSYGADFVPRQRLVPEAVPEFAATDAYVGELIAEPGEAVIRPDLTPEDVKTAWTELKQRIGQSIQRILTCSQIVVPLPEGPDRTSVQPVPIHSGGAKVALIWGAIGLLLTIQADWVLHQVLQTRSEQAIAETSALTDPGIPAAAATVPQRQPLSNTAPSLLLDVPFNPAIEESLNGFPSDRFTQPHPDAQTEDSLQPSPAPVTTVILDSPFPTFNSQQLDEKIALYYQRWLLDSGPPDVLVVGSSRALRGVDPVMLKQQLAELGYTDVSVFNFGVNGATAQVVDLILRRILTPDQLPRLIVWADGARALNSGAVDVTYNGIAVSEGYRQLTAGTLAVPAQAELDPDVTTTFAGSSGLGASLAESYQNIDRWLSDRLALVSAAHGDRDRLKSLMLDGLRAFLPASPSTQPVLLTTDSPTQGTGGSDPNSPLIPAEGATDINGFLPLTLQFNPATYYQQYARVAGQYDSDYDDFRIDGKQAIALNALLQLTRSHNIPVIFVNLPLTDDYLDPVRMQYEQEFKQYMLTLAINGQGLVFRDLGDLWLDQYDYFSDPSHLNRYGASTVSTHLSQDPMIPWFKSVEGEK